MDAAKLQSKIYSGYAKASFRIGRECTVYRAGSALGSVISSGNVLGTTYASFNAQDMSYGKPNIYGKALWYGLFDATNYDVGDYLVDTEDGTFFIAAKQLALPILMVQCNRTVTISRSPVIGQTGSAGYGGGDETPIQGPLPASILYGERGLGLPIESDARNPMTTILFPSYPGVVINVSDILTDDLSRRFMIQAAELTDLGWRIQGEEIFISRQVAIGSLASALR